MAERLKLNAARAPRKREQAAPQGRRRRPTQSILTDRDFAELEALLMEDLRRAPSPSIAGDGDSEAAAPRPAAPAPVRRPALRAERARNDNPVPVPHPRDLDGDFEAADLPPEPRLTPRPRRPMEAPPPYTLPRDARRSAVTRALRFGATFFSLLALVGVSALLVLLAVGGERAAVRVAEDAANGDAVMAGDANGLPPAAERADVPLIKGPAVVGQEGDRIPSEDAPSPRGGGVVRAAEAPDASAPAPQADSAPASAAADASMLQPEPTLPPEEPAAPAELASVAETPTGSIPQAPAGPAAAEERTARVTTHVNLRAKPENDAAVVAVVPAGKDVGIVACERWCEVAYDGRQGYIHQRFLKE